MHLLAFSQGVSTLSTAFGEEDFVRREVRQMHDWLTGLIEAAAAGGTAGTRH